MVIEIQMSGLIAYNLLTCPNIVVHYAIMHSSLGMYYFIHAEIFSRHIYNTYQVTNL